MVRALGNMKLYSRLRMLGKKQDFLDHIHCLLAVGPFGSVPLKKKYSKQETGSNHSVSPGLCYSTESRQNLKWI
jgi:hypothetical protein